ncbi:hypothetical protein ACM39_18575 [Chryseobacterium sp. FH2]|uniref:hypothetical protein n=1 Tax=Chryseobacterium sp. FH2 TaxID=1674291 RepID=UPI00065AAE16|nr:hypothetical protein [Chryseobacterium sp. FH2]KMQ58539.1 hypothetical protein ACM39_18575 [Chryseobacterium sp. FH2]
MSKITIIGGDLIEEIGGSYKIFAKEGYEISSNKKVVFNAKDGIIYGAPEAPTAISTINSIVNFVVYPRVWTDSPEMMNYNFDWDRTDDEKFYIRSKKHSEIFDNCIKGKDIFADFYNETKVKINSKEYSPPYLRIFKNHNIVTGQDVILSLYITFDDVKKITNNKISLEYDTSIFDVGFTDDGKTINNKEFIIEKKYFSEEYYSLPDNDEGRKTRYEIVVTNYKDEKLLVINKFIIKCKQGFSENQQIKFLNEKKEIVGILTVRPNDSFIFSKRKFKYIKIKRKSYITQDLENIKQNLTGTYIKDAKGKEVKFENENSFLQKFTEKLTNAYFSKIGVSFSSNFSLDEIEIDETKLIEKQIISNSAVLDGAKYLIEVQEQFFKEKGITKEQLKDNIFVFISPIDEPPKTRNNEKTGAFVVYEDVFTFSSMVYNFEADTILHEIGHEMGLKHPFEIAPKDISSKQIYLDQLKNNKIIYQGNLAKIEGWRKDYDVRKPKDYPFKFGEESISDKINWKKRIDEIESESKTQIADLENKIISTENLIKFYTRIEEYHKIYFIEKVTDTIMDYDSFKYGFFDYQFDIITKLYEEFKHI